MPVFSGNLADFSNMGISLARSFTATLRYWLGFYCIRPNISFCLDGTSFWANGHHIHFFEPLELIVEYVVAFLSPKNMLNS